MVWHIELRKSSKRESTTTRTTTLGKFAFLSSSSLPN
jgi:hypothetical protein